MPTTGDVDYNESFIRRKNFVGMTTKSKFTSRNLNALNKAPVAPERSNTVNETRYGPSRLLLLGKMGSRVTGPKGGGIAVPTPINTPSLKKENNGQDVSIPLVPKGGAGWGAGPTKSCAQDEGMEGKVDLAAKAVPWLISQNTPPADDGSGLQGYCPDRTSMTGRWGDDAVEEDQYRQQRGLLSVDFPDLASQQETVSKDLRENGSYKRQNDGDRVYFRSGSTADKFEHRDHDHGMRSRDDGFGSVERGFINYNSGNRDYRSDRLPFRDQYRRNSFDKYDNFGGRPGKEDVSWGWNEDNRLRYNPYPDNYKHGRNFDDRYPSQGLNRYHDAQDWRGYGNGQYRNQRDPTFSRWEGDAMPPAPLDGSPPRRERMSYADQPAFLNDGDLHGNRDRGAPPYRGRDYFERDQEIYTELRERGGHSMREEYNRDRSEYGYQRNEKDNHRMDQTIQVEKEVRSGSMYEDDKLRRVSRTNELCDDPTAVVGGATLSQHPTIVTGFYSGPREERQHTTATEKNDILNDTKERCTPLQSLPVQLSSDDVTHHDATKKVEEEVQISSEEGTVEERVFVKRNKIDGESTNADKKNPAPKMLFDPKSGKMVEASVVTGKEKKLLLSHRREGNKRETSFHDNASLDGQIKTDEAPAVDADCPRKIIPSIADRNNLSSKSTQRIAKETKTISNDLVIAGACNKKSEKGPRKKQGGKKTLKQRNGVPQDADDDFFDESKSGKATNHGERSQKGLPKNLQVKPTIKAKGVAKNPSLGDASKRGQTESNSLLINHSSSPPSHHDTVDVLEGSLPLHQLTIPVITDTTLHVGTTTLKRIWEPLSEKGAPSIDLCSLSGPSLHSRPSSLDGWGASSLANSTTKDLSWKRIASGGRKRDDQSKIEHTESINNMVDISNMEEVMDNLAIESSLVITKKTNSKRPNRQKKVVKMDAKANTKSKENGSTDLEEEMGRERKDTSDGTPKQKPLARAKGPRKAPAAAAPHRGKSGLTLQNVQEEEKKKKKKKDEVKEEEVEVKEVKVKEVKVKEVKVKNKEEEEKKESPRERGGGHPTAAASTDETKVPSHRLGAGLGGKVDDATNKKAGRPSSTRKTTKKIYVAKVKL